MANDDNSRSRASLLRLVDALPQPPDRFDQVVAFAAKLGVLLLDLAQFLLGEQVDRAEPFALALDAFEAAFDLADLRQFVVGL
jgi:hypothetical protein